MNAAKTRSTFTAGVPAVVLGSSATILGAVNAQAFEPVNTRLTDSQIIANAICPECMRWHWSGVCFWMTCTIVGCDFEESERYSHYIPEVVVTSYSGDSPWEDSTFGLSESNGTQSQGNGQEAPNDPDHLRFKNVDIVGSPALFVFDSLANNGLYCKSSSDAYFPYYVSSLDYQGWRYGLPESFYPTSLFSTRIDNEASDASLTWTLDSSYSNWGPLYPRQGFLIQQDDPKAAAVMAQRAADFTSRAAQPHIYRQLANTCDEEKCWPPGDVVLKDEDTHLWQMLYPNMEQTCGLFGQSDDWSSGVYAYAWHLWRPWSCCEPAGAIYLGAVTTD